MGLFSKKTSFAKNRIENFGRWPVRLTHFQLIDEYAFPATNFPEIFFVREGNFLHETDVGTQAVREGAVIVVNPGHRHIIKEPEGVSLARIRFLPEWLTREYQIIVNSTDVLSLFFDQSWFHYPRDENLHVFTTKGEAAARVRSELEYFREQLREKPRTDPVIRVSFIKLLMLLADEHKRFWRGNSEVEVLPEAKYALDRIEIGILQAAPFDPRKMPPGGFEKTAIEKAFRDLTGMSMHDYTERRRVFHAACRLLTDSAEPRVISKDLGYPTTGEFAEKFEAVFDIPPKVYREKFGPVVEE